MVKHHLESEVRSVRLFRPMLEALDQYVKQGDGVFTTPCFLPEVYPNQPLIDTSLEHAVQLLATAFGANNQVQAKAIFAHMAQTNQPVEFIQVNSAHPLFADGTFVQQNLCVLGAMLFLGIPIPSYFNGQTVLVPRFYSNIPTVLVGGGRHDG